MPPHAVERREGVGVTGAGRRGSVRAYVKPSAYVGSDHSANWAVELGIELLGFLAGLPCTLRKAGDPESGPG